MPKSWSSPSCLLPLLATLPTTDCDLPPANSVFVNSRIKCVAKSGAKNTVYHSYFEKWEHSQPRLCRNSLSLSCPCPAPKPLQLINGPHHCPSPPFPRPISSSNFRPRTRTLNIVCLLLGAPTQFPRPQPSWPLSTPLLTYQSKKGPKL